LKKVVLNLKAQKKVQKVSLKWYECWGDSRPETETKSFMRVMRKHTPLQGLSAGFCG